MIAILRLTADWAIRVLAGSFAAGMLVALAERRFRRARKQLLSRNDEFRPERPMRPSPLAEAAHHGSGANGGHIGHSLVADGPMALAARLVLVRSAVNALGLQYYPWHDDLAGRLMARAVLQAAKIMLADGRLAVIGSYNLDQRSAEYNTEVVLLIEGEAFALELAAIMRQVRSPSQSYRIELRRGRLVWIGDGAVLTREPNATLPARLLAVGMRVLPVEWLL